MSQNRLLSAFSVGFVLFVATLLTIAGLFWVGSGKGLFQSQAEYHFLCPSTSGLKKGAKVYLSGVSVGVVTDINFVEDLEVSDVRVTVSVRESVALRIRADSLVSLKSEGLLGDNSVQISVGNIAEDPLGGGGQIPFHESSLFEDVVGAETTRSAAELMAELVGLLRTIRAGDGSIGKLLIEPELYDNLAKFTSSLDKLAVTLDGVATDMDSIIDEVKQERGALGKLIFSKEYEESIARTLSDSSKLIASLERIVESTQSSDSIVMRLLTDEELADSVVAIVQRIGRGAESFETILAKIENGEGSLGPIVNDPSIIRSLQDVFIGVQELGYVRNVIRNAESLGREVSAGTERASQMARLEASRARFLGSIRQSNGASGKLVPSTSKSDEGETEKRRVEK